VKQDRLQTSPAALVDRVAPEETRKRVLTDVELAAVWKAATAEGYPFGDLTRLLILTGARRSEVRQAPWAELDLTAALWKLPGERTKNGHEHVVPLSGLTLEILTKMPRFKGGKWLFGKDGGEPSSTSLSGQKSRLDKATLALLRQADPKAELAPWTLHDCRRTLATGLQSLGFSIEVIEAVLNHKGGVVSGIAGVYARHGYSAEKKQALDAWARHIEKLVDGGTADVIPIATRKARRKRA
jgi:integrase